MPWVSEKEKRYTSSKRKTSLPLLWQNSIIENRIWFPASCGRLPAIAFGFLQVAQDLLQLHFVINTPVCNFLQLHFIINIPVCNLLQLQLVSRRVAQDFRTPPVVSRRLWESSGDLRKCKTGVFVISVHRICFLAAYGRRD